MSILLLFSKHDFSNDRDASFKLNENTGSLYSHPILFV